MKLKNCLIISLLLFLTALCFSERIEYDKEKEFIIETSFLTEKQYSSIKKWIYQTFENSLGSEEEYEKITKLRNRLGISQKSFNEIKILDEDKENNQINFNIKNLLIQPIIARTSYLTVDFKCVIQVKNNKYRVNYSDIAMNINIYSHNKTTDEYVVSLLTPKKMKDKYVNILNNKLELYTNNFKKILEFSPKEDENSDW